MEELIQGGISEKWGIEVFLQILYRLGTFSTNPNSPQALKRVSTVGDALEWLEQHSGCMVCDGSTHFEDQVIYRHLANIPT